MQLHHFIRKSAGILTFLLSVSVFAQTLTVYTEESPPSSFTKNGRLTGVSVEVVRELLRRLGEGDHIRAVPWKRGYLALQNEKNVALFATTRTAEREDLFQWVGPILRLKWVLYAEKNSKIRVNSLEDAKKVGRIGAYREDAREQFLKKQGFMNLESVSRSVQNINKLVHGRIDLWVSSNLGVGKVAEEANTPRSMIKEVYVIKKADLYVAFSRKTDPATVQKWQTTLDQMKRDGSFTKIYTSWLPGESPPLKGQR